MTLYKNLSFIVHRSFRLRIIRSLYLFWDRIVILGFTFTTILGRLYDRVYGTGIRSDLMIKNVSVSFMNFPVLLFRQ